MSSFILTRTLNVRIWLSKNIHLRLKKRVQENTYTKEKKLNHNSLWYGSNYLAPWSNFICSIEKFDVWLVRKHWFLTRPRFHDDGWLRRRWCGSSTNIFVLFLLQLIFHGFRLTHETTQTCVSLFRYAGIKF